MTKIILYALLFSVGGYYASGHIPDSIKSKFLSAIGFFGLKEKSFEVLNPSAKRMEILEKLEDNLSKIEQIKSNADGLSKEVESPKNAGINIKGEPLTEEEIDLVIEESKTLLEEAKGLNSKTGVLPAVVGKIFGVGSDSQPQTRQLIGVDQITPELKEEICK